MGIPDSILLKPDALTDDEYSKIKNHPELGCRILERVKGLEDVLPMILSHHERIDGKGYPNGLDDGNIPEGAKIIAIADAYDAMTSNRPYRKALGRDEAVRRLREGKGTQFSPELVDLFIEVLKDLEHANKAGEVPPAKFVKRDTRKKGWDIFNINTLGSRIVYGLIIIGLIPILMGIIYITNISISTISKFDENLRDQQVVDLYRKINQKKADFEEITMNYSNSDALYDRVAIKDYPWLDNIVSFWLSEHNDIDIVGINDINGTPVILRNGQLIDDKLTT
jgi:hypothetical protein